MNKYVEKSLKITGAFCAATGVVALSALVASGAAVGAVVEGFKTAGKTMKKVLEEDAQVKDCAVSKTEEQVSTGEEELAVEEQTSAEEMNATAMQTEDSGMNSTEAVTTVENNESV